MQVLDALVVVTGVVERRLVGISFKRGIRNRNVHLVTELLEVLERQLLHLVGRVATLEAGAEAVTLDGLRKDDRRLSLVLACCLEGSVNLAVVVATALEVPDLVVSEVLNHLECARVAAEEVLSNVGA